MAACASFQSLFSRIKSAHLCQSSKVYPATVTRTRQPYKRDYLTFCSVNGLAVVVALFLVGKLFYNFRLIPQEFSLAIEHTKLLLCLEIIAPSEQEFTPFSVNVTKSLSSQLFQCTQRHNDICCKSSDKSFKIGNCKRQEQVLTFFRLLQLHVADFRPTTCA